MKARACSLKNKVFIKTKSLSVQRRDFEGKTKGFIKPKGFRIFRISRASSIKSKTLNTD